jgi:hypothetical protein
MAVLPDRQQLNVPPDVIHELQEQLNPPLNLELGVLECHGVLATGVPTSERRAVDSEGL